jgi:hypothetical protein
LSGSSNKFRTDSSNEFTSVFSHSPKPLKCRNDCATLAPCAWRLLMFCACLSTGQIGGYQPGTDPLRMFCSSVTDSVSTTTRTRSTTGSLVVSLSDGTLSLLEPDQTSQLVITSTWLAHAHEPWCVAWSYDDPNVIYSGAGVLLLFCTKTF